MPATLKINQTHGLTMSNLKKLEKQEKKASNLRRITTIRMIMEGYMGKDVAKLLGIHRQSVSEYVKKFENGGLDELLNRKPIPGKAPLLSSEQQVQLKELILNEAQKTLQVDQESFWNTKILQHVIKEKFRVEMSREAIRTTLHRMNFSCTKATNVLKKADKEKEISFQKQIELIKKNHKREYGVIVSR